MKKIALFSAALQILIGSSQGAIFQLGLNGSGGSGLLPTNVNGTVNGTPGIGGIVEETRVSHPGIQLDTETNFLSIEFIGWGETWNRGPLGSLGFRNLSGLATAAHLHYSTADPAPGGFGQNAVNSIDLNFNGSPFDGGISTDVSLTPEQAAAIINGLAYIDVHTELNPDGEMRGHLVVIPEPAISAFLMPVAAVLLFRRRRPRRSSIA